MLDAPVSGTGLQAEAAEIVIYASGDTTALDQVRPVFDAVAKVTFDLGSFGNGSKMKFVANLLVSVHNLATAEAFVMGMKAGLGPQQILDVVSAGVGSSRIFEIRGPMMVEDAYPPPNSRCSSRTSTSSVILVAISESQHHSLMRVSHGTRRRLSRSWATSMQRLSPGCWKQRPASLVSCLSKIPYGFGASRLA